MLLYYCWLFYYFINNNSSSIYYFPLVVKSFVDIQLRVQKWTNYSTYRFTHCIESICVNVVYPYEHSEL